MKVLFIGDIIGKLGRQACKKALPEIMANEQPDIIIANGENAAHGYGITENVYRELIEMGIDAVSMGNHIWDKKDIVNCLDKMPMLVRPANYPTGTPGQDHLVITKKGIKYALINVSGRTFMSPLECPFKTTEKIVTQLESTTKNIIVDIHAEATSEKNALGWFLDGTVTAVVGTHTHVQTADERVLPKGTAYISDIGMCGGYNSIIGMSKEKILSRFLTQMPERFEPTEDFPALFNAVLIKFDGESGKAAEIKRIKRVFEG